MCVCLGEERGCPLEDEEEEEEEKALAGGSGCVLSWVYSELIAARTGERLLLALCARGFALYPNSSYFHANS
jgi:hypothetical protein